MPVSDLRQRARRRTRLGPDHDLRGFQREDREEELSPRGRDVAGREAAEMDEEPCQRREIERPLRSQGSRERSEGAG